MAGRGIGIVAGPRALVHALLVAAVALGGCGDATGPDQARVNGLDLRLDVSPGTVAPGEALLAQLSIHNTRPKPALLESRCASLGSLRVTRGAADALLRGATGGCRPAITSIRIPPGETLRTGWVVTAQELDGVLAAPGQYTLRVDFHTRLPSLERKFRVR